MSLAFYLTNSFLGQPRDLPYVCECLASHSEFHHLALPAFKQTNARLHCLYNLCNLQI